MGRSRASVLILAGLASVSTWNCALLSNVDQLEEVQCIDACDASPAIGDGANDTGANGDEATDTGANGDGATDTGDATSAYRAAVLADTPVGYWRLNDPAGSASCHDETNNG